MGNNIDLDTWNRSSMNLVQALCGAITPNFRRVILDHNGTAWVLRFILEKESEEDREEIESIATDFYALFSRGPEVEVEVYITSDAMEWPKDSARVMFQRKE